MECLHVSSLLLLLGACSSCIGSVRAEVNINVPASIVSKQPTSGSCVATGKAYSWAPRYSFIRVKLMDSNNEGQCSIKFIGRIQQLGDAHYQQKFNITCNNTINSVGLKCFTYVSNDMTQKHVQVIKPKITSKCTNVTTEVGLSVTLTCHVEGDPDHYWVGWMSRNTIIHAGDEHSISTTSNSNGTTHHLTIHRVTVANKYECKLYTTEGDAQEQVTHHVIVNEENHENSKSPSSPSFLNILSSFLF